MGLGLSLACSSDATPTVTTPPATTPPPAQWVQVWSDEFDGPASAQVDDTKWNYDAADGCSAGICGWGNNEKEYYSADPATISLNGQGQLMIVAQRAPAGLTCYYGPCRYTSAKITTRAKMFASPGRVEARIKELEAIIKNHVIIEKRTELGVVGMGNTVRFAEDGADEETYRIVGPAEADPKAGRVSYESALGKALIGHRVGDEVDINTPGGRYSVRITAIE